MKPAIALLTNEYMASYLIDTVKDMQAQCDITVVPYRFMRDLWELFPRIEAAYDGFCTTGNLAMEVVRNALPGCTKPIGCIARESVDYYKNFFLLLSENRTIDFHRVVLDFSLRSDIPPYTVVDFHSAPGTFETRRDQYVEQMDMDKILSLEDRILQSARALWAQGAFDLVICRYGSVASALEQEGIPVSFVYPDPDRVTDTLDILVSGIKLRHMGGSLPGVIYVTTEKLQNDDIQAIDMENVSLQKCLLDYSHQNAADFMIQRSAQGYELFTTQHRIRKMTADFTCCPLQSYLFGALGQDVFVGYGIGRDILQARTNALEAGRAAHAYNRSQILAQDGVLRALAPPSSAIEKANDLIQRQAETSGLSTNTIARILSVMEVLGTNELTSQDLAVSLRVTVANANRFLNNLLKVGLAEIISEKKSLSKGRPSKVYRVLL